MADGGYESLFEHLWDAEAALTVSGGRGANAQADQEADKTIKLPDWRGKTAVGTNAVGLPNGENVGFLMRNVGDEDHTLTVDELAAHTHSETRHTLNRSAAGASWAGQRTVATTGSADGDDPHNNMQPFGLAT